VDDVINYSARSMYTPFASCRLRGCRCRLCNRCSTLLSSLSSPTSLQLGGALPHPLTASVLMLFFVEQTNPDSGHRLCHLTFLQFEDLCSTADNEVTNFFQKCLHSRTTYYVHFFHHNPPHHNDTASDGVHTPFSYLPSF